MCRAVYHCCDTGDATGLKTKGPTYVVGACQIEKPLARLTRGLSYGALAIALTPFLEGIQSATGAGLLALLADVCHRSGLQLRDSAGLSPASPFSPSIRALGTSAANYSIMNQVYHKDGGVSRELGFGINHVS